MNKLIELAEKENMTVEQFMREVLACTASIAHTAIDKHADPDAQNSTEFILQSGGYSFKISVERNPIRQRNWEGIFDRRKERA
jgi:hypothetical protein